MAAAEEAVAAAAVGEEVLVAVATDNQNKRKLEDLEPESGGVVAESDSNAADTAGDSEPDRNKPDEEDASEAKRPRLEDVHASENGHEKEKTVDETPKEESEQPVNVENNVQSEDGHEESKETSTTVTTEQPAGDDQQTGDTQQPSVEEEKLQDETTQGLSKEEGQEVSANIVQEGGEQQSVSETQTTSHKMEVPNNKVGVLIGKAGDTIRYLQYNSGAKIQITRDADADPHAPTRLVELIGTSESINKAEKLIKDVIAEADVGGSPALVARGFSTVQAITGEQLEIQVPNEKVGLIIGKGGETIKSLQTRSGARIQLIPQHPPEGEHSKERTVRVTGDRKQIDIAREMIKEVMNQTVRQSPLSSGYGQQGFRPRGPAAPQWGPRGGHSSHFTGYDHQQRGPYPSQNQQYPPSSYGNYPAQSAARNSFGPGWEQRPSSQGPPPQANYNYGQQQGSEYGQPAPYLQSGSYGHGYNEGHGGPQQHQYGHSGTQPATYHQSGGPYPGYNAQDPYAKQQPSYGMPQQAPHAQSYVQPRPNQPVTQSYAPNVPPQQSYPYAASVPTQQSYPAYGAAPAVDGYSHAQPTAAAGSYPQQGAQPALGYAQPGAQQPTGYGQAPAAGGYGSYPSQPGYTDQAAATNAGYGYQGQAETTYGTAPASAAAYAAQPTAQAGYAQPAPVQQAYDQSAATQQSGYGAAVPAPAAYGKTAVPQPGYAQYDASQTYGAHH